MLEQAGELREKYRARLQTEIDNLRSTVRASSTTSSILSCEAAEFVPSSLPQLDYYRYYQQDSYLPTHYSGYDQQYFCYDQTSLSNQSQVESSTTEPDAQIWNNMLDILKT